MGRPPPQSKKESAHFRFTKTETEEMQRLLAEITSGYPTRDVIQSITTKFNSAAERSGKVHVQESQVRNWFYKRGLQRSKGTIVPVEAPRPINIAPQCSDNVNLVTAPSETVHALPETEYEFEARSSKDGAWYDVASFLDHRKLDDEYEVRVRFEGYGPEHDEWVNVKASIRQRSVAFDESECVTIGQETRVLCFQETDKQSIYFDAVVMDVERKRHDVRGCRCKFIIRYEHNNAEDKVPLRRLYKRKDAHH